MPGRNELVDVGVCVLNWNSGPNLAVAVESARKAVPHPEEQIVVVDNASNDSSLQILVERCPNTKIVQNRQNLGYGAGNNVGARWLARKGFDYLLFVNPDVILDATTIQFLRECFRRDARAGCAGGVPIHPSGRQTAVARRKADLLEKVIADSFLQRLLPAPLLRIHFLYADQAFEGQRVYCLAYGACVMYRTDAFWQVQGFDERVFLYSEEFIMAERLLKAGWHVVVSPGAKYVHIGGASTRRIPLRRRLHLIQSEQHVVRNYYGWSSTACHTLFVWRCCELPYYALKAIFLLALASAGKG